MMAQQIWKAYCPLVVKMSNNLATRSGGRFVLTSKFKVLGKTFSLRRPQSYNLKITDWPDYNDSLITNIGLLVPEIFSLEIYEFLISSLAYYANDM